MGGSEVQLHRLGRKGSLFSQRLPALSTGLCGVATARHPPSHPASSAVSTAWCSWRACHIQGWGGGCVSVSLPTTLPCPKLPCPQTLGEGVSPTIKDQTPASGSQTPGRVHSDSGRHHTASKGFPQPPQHGLFLCCPGPAEHMEGRSVKGDARLWGTFLGFGAWSPFPIIMWQPGQPPWEASEGPPGKRPERPHALLPLPQCSGHVSDASISSWGLCSEAPSLDWPWGEAVPPGITGLSLGLVD